MGGLLKKYMTSDSHRECNNLKTFFFFACFHLKQKSIFLFLLLSKNKYGEMIVTFMED